MTTSFTCYVCEAAQGPVWNSPGSATFLANTLGKLLKWGFQVNPYVVH